MIASPAGSSLRRVRLLIWKEFTQLRRDPLLLRVLIVMPLLQLIMFGYVVAADVKDLPTAVVDLDRTSTSRLVDDSLGSSGYFVVRSHPASEASLRALMDSGEVKVGMVIPEGTQAALERGESPTLGLVVDGTDAQVASLASGYAARIVAEVNERRMSSEGLTIAAPGVDARVRVMFVPSLDAVNTMIPGLIGTILLISISVIMSQAVVRERESGTLEHMFCTPIRPGEYLVAKVVPYALLAAVQATIVALAGAFWFRVPFNGSLPLVVCGLGLFMLTCIGTGLLVSLISHTRAQAQQTMMLAVMIPNMALSGFIFPVSSMPEPVQPVANALPLTWALAVLRGVIVKGASAGAVATPLAVLAGFAVVVFGAAIVATHRRLAE